MKNPDVPEDKIESENDSENRGVVLVSDEHLVLLRESEEVFVDDKSRDESNQVKNDGGEIDPIR